MECWRLLIDASDPKPGDQFPGWPKTVHMLTNYGKSPQGYLPEMKFRPGENPVVQVIDEADGEIVYTLRVKGTTFRPKVFRKGTYTIKVADPDKGQMKTIERVRSVDATH